MHASSSAWGSTLTQLMGMLLGPSALANALQILLFVLINH